MKKDGTPKNKKKKAQDDFGTEKSGLPRIYSFGAEILDFKPSDAAVRKTLVFGMDQVIL